MNDLVGNIRDSSGFGGWLLRMMEFAGDAPHIPKPVKLKMVADKVALRAQLTQWAELESLNRVLLSHGDTIEERPSQALLELASSLE